MAWQSLGRHYSFLYINIMALCLSCACNEGNCSCYRFLRDYLSPNVPVTTLVITGNHPATLVARIEYERAQPYFGSNSEWFCQPTVVFGSMFDSPLGATNLKCCVSGAADFDCEESPTVWQDSFCCQQTRSGSISFKSYLCCNRPGENNDEWINNISGNISGSFGISNTVTHAVWYRRLAVRMYAGEQYGCCGVWVEACLTFVRLTPGVVNTQSHLSGSVTYHDYSCFGVLGEEPLTGTCTVDCGTPVTGPIACPEPFNLETLTDCGTPLFESQGLLYSISRRKFVPGDPSCTARNLPQLSVTLTSADNITQIVGCGGCGANQREGGPFPDFCVPDRVYYDRGTYADATSACCGPPPTVSCGAAGSKTAGFAAFLGACHTPCDDDTEFYRLAIWNCADDECTGTVGGGLGSNNVSDWANLLANCYVPHAAGNVTEIESRTNTVEDECSIDPCNYLLFGEIDDTWTLTITLPS